MRIYMFFTQTHMPVFIHSHNCVLICSGAHESTENRGQRSMLKSEISLNLKTKKENLFIL